MAWLAVNKNGDEVIYNFEPFRDRNIFIGEGGCVQLPKGTIKKLIGKDLIWKDKPVEIE